MAKQLSYGDITAIIPPDVKKYGQKKALLCVLYFILGEVVAVFSAYLFSTNSNQSATIITYSIAVMIPFVITGFPVKLIDKSFIGEIVKVNVSTTSTTSMKEGPMHVSQNNQVNIYIREANGNILVKKAYKEEAKKRHGFKDYQLGDIVVHVYGTEPIFVLPLKPSMNCKCAVCKTQVSYQDVCPSCGHTLIKAHLSEDSSEVLNEKE